MKKYMKYSNIIIALMIGIMLFSSCKDFFDPKQELDVTQDELFNDRYEYRSVEMGLYALQQQLAEQLLVLGELRADLLTITPNAEADLVEVYNFNMSKTNKYASPINFFKLIAACNNFIRVLEREHPEILDKSIIEVSNYDRLYGEALCMRAWAYFTAVKIYGKVPYIHESLVTMEEIENFVNSSGTYIDSVYISFSRDGYYNDTTFNEPITLEKNFYDINMVIDHFANELENNIKAVGVRHDKDNPDPTWEITIWNTYAMDALLGTMYLTQGDLTKAAEHFDNIILNNTETYRYQLTNAFAGGRWGSIFSEINNREHIYTIYFDKANFQQNNFQNLFLPIAPYKYMLKPTAAAILKWETVWRAQSIARNDANPSLTRMTFLGIPSDYFRGYGSSYLYINNGVVLDGNSYVEMLDLKSKGDTRGVSNIMDGMDTIVVKYSIGQDLYSDDANFIIYRAASIHLYQAEIYAYRVYNYNGAIKTNLNAAKGIINDGAYYDVSVTRLQLGVRGRVGLGSGDDALDFNNIRYFHDPFTNEITGYINIGNNTLKKQQYFEEDLLDERARELAFEGERFYDLIRIAKRRNDPAFLANIVSAKYPAGKREQIYNYLLDENNWYVKYFDE
jgi:hypothetical protein